MWTVRNGIHATVHDKTGDRIATVAPALDEHERARLIAAAPALLESCRALLELHIAHHNEPVHAAARATIARATGEA